MIFYTCTKIQRVICLCLVGDRDVGRSADSGPGEMCPAAGRDLYSTSEGRFQLQTNQLRVFSTGALLVVYLLDLVLHCSITVLK